MANEVSLSEQPLTLPTYVIGPPERHPIFYTGRAYQGAKGPIYPYPLLDRLGDRREDRAYRAIYLENKYIQLCVLPQLGGRIFSAVDKTNGYDFVYRQHVAKPALIGMLGAWISGGAEWNIPHHHRPTTFLPVDWRTQELPDGSKTLWLGELEWRHRMRWAVGLTLHPGRSYVQVDVRICNRTPLAQSMLCFVNWAVHVNEQYQVVFPPLTQWGAQHAKCEFVRWPIGDGTYAGVDYRNVDLSWWRNHPSPVSIFACNHECDFFGGYDHARQAGTVCVADHHVWPGMKFFTFGNGPSGRMWDRILTDEDGPYLELMSGAWSDNQPDYSWIEPYETRQAVQYWYPVRQLGAFHNANRDAAVSLQRMPDGQVRAAFNATARHEQAVVTIRLGSRELLRQRVAIGPDRPFACQVALPDGTAWSDVEASLHAGGAELIQYRPVNTAPEARPIAVSPPEAPGTFSTVEELALAGQRVEQFHSTTLEAEPYYREALRRDAGNSRAATALGILELKRGRFAEGRELLQSAADRLTNNHTRPKDGEALYYLGLARRALEDRAGAVTALEQAAWTAAFRAASCYQLAELAAAGGDCAAALSFLEWSLARNAANVKALSLKAAVLRRLGRATEAMGVLDAAQQIDPLDHWLAYERVLCLEQDGQSDVARQARSDLASLRGEAQTFLELACDYEGCGQLAQAADVLRLYLGQASEKSCGWRAQPAFEPPLTMSIDRMVYYALHFYAQKQGDAGAAAEHLRQARQLSAEYAFPFRTESVHWLRQAMESAPDDAQAAWMLGNLLYDLQPREAVAAWEQAVKGELPPQQAAGVYRNLALAYAKLDQDLDKALASMETAIRADGQDPRLLMERDVLLEARGVDHARRLELLEARAGVVSRRDDCLLRQIVLYVLLGQYDRAIELLNGRHWHIWEGMEHGVHDVYVDARLLKGRQLARAGRHEEALAEFLVAAEYPERFEVGPPYDGGRTPEVWWLAGQAHLALGQNQAGLEALERAARPHNATARPGMSTLPPPDSPMLYYRALACRRLGRQAEANELLARLTDLGRQMLTSSPSAGFFNKFGARQPEPGVRAQGHYLLALSLLGRGDLQAAQHTLEQAVRLNPSHLAACTMLAHPDVSAFSPL